MAVPPEKAAEAERATLLLHVALVQLGAQAMADTLTLWEDVPPVPGATGARATQRWLGMAVRYVMRRRIRARDLALAYYRYQRALVTGTTIALPGQENPPYITLPELKREFEAYLTLDLPPDEVPSEDSEARAPDEETQVVSEAVSEPLSASEEPSEADDEDEDDLDRILIEEIEGLEAELAAIEEAAEAEIEQALTNLGPKIQDKKIAEITVENPDELDAERAEAHKAAGRRQAASASRVVMNGVRGSIFHIGTRDPRVVGFARVSRTGTPCGWCAMLISRGFIPIEGRLDGSNLYRSAQMSSADVVYGDLDLYHDNCQCYAVPILDAAQMESDDLFALNRKYADQWPRVTKGLGGKSAISAWRRFIRQEAKSQKSPEAAA